MYIFSRKKIHTQGTNYAPLREKYFVFLLKFVHFIPRVSHGPGYSHHVTETLRKLFLTAVEIVKIGYLPILSTLFTIAEIYRG